MVSPSRKMGWGIAFFLAVQVMGAYGVGVGVNWGTQAAQSMEPSTIVQLLKDNNIQKIKLFDSDPWMVDFFAGTGIDVMLGIPNNQLAYLAESYDNAFDWVKENLTRAHEKGVQIRFVAVGNEPFLKTYNGSNLKTMFPALFSLTDENQKSIAPGDFERHWGIFSYDGHPKFELDFKGNGDETMPIAAKGVQYLNQQWCVFNTDVKTMDPVTKQVEYACNFADCTALNHNGTCSTISKSSKISYAFNSYFQAQSQDVRACDFEGTARLVEYNASTGGCLFPLALDSAAVRPITSLAVMLMLVTVTPSFW